VHPLSSALSEAGWQRGPSVVVAEGLLMYLPPDAVRALFTALHEQTGPGSRVVFTWLPRSSGAMNLSPLIRAGVALVGEPVRFSVSPAGLSGLLRDTGWTLLPATDLHARYLQGTPLAGESVTSMEHFSVAQWATRSGTDSR
jgi:O-methyltransferase involved in polyketide biosynthesis